MSMNLEHWVSYFCVELLRTAKETSQVLHTILKAIAPWEEDLYFKGW